MEWKFEWDEKKNKINRVKHGVSFEEAQTVFKDEYALLIHDEAHSIDEERFIIIGRDAIFRELHVCHCYRSNDIIRIISARKATKTEISIYRRK